MTIDGLEAIVILQEQKPTEGWHLLYIYLMFPRENKSIIVVTLCHHHNSIVQLSGSH